MLTRDEIYEKLKSVLIGMDAKNRDKFENATDSTKLLTDLGLSSVGMLYLVIAVEETFGIVFDNEKPFETVGEVVDFITEKLR